MLTFDTLFVLGVESGAGWAGADRPVAAHLTGAALQQAATVVQHRAGVGAHAAQTEARIVAVVVTPTLLVWKHEISRSKW